MCTASTALFAQSCLHCLLRCCDFRSAVYTGKSTAAAAYWGYVVPTSLLNLAASVMHFSRLLVVFDLDETLLMAHTVDSLQQRIRRVNASR